MGPGRTTCCTPGSRTTRHPDPQLPWGRHGLIGIRRGEGAFFGKTRVISMRPGRDDRRMRGGGRALMLLMGATLLSGCSLASSIGSSDTVSSISNRFAGLFSSAKPGVTQPASPTPSSPDIECPGVDIRTGASTLEVAAKTGQATAADLRYQLSFGQTARECLVQGGVMTIKVGVQGRVILGPMGRAGPSRCPAALRSGSRGCAAQDDCDQVQAASGDRGAGSNPRAIRRCGRRPDLSGAAALGDRCLCHLCRV